MEIEAYKTLKSFYKGRKVFITGHTGFKGSWLCKTLAGFGAELYGYSLNPPTDPALYNLTNVNDIMKKSFISDIRDFEKLKDAVMISEPEIILHLAAQPLVRDSYKNTLDTYSINVMGTANILETLKHQKSVRVFLNITTDKVYENKEWSWGYRENDSLGGRDPYSASKSCSEIITSSFRESFFPKARYSEHKVSIGTARAGNVIGGGDFAADRLVPDIFRSVFANQMLELRNPNSMRPWQHILDPLNGYILLAERMYHSSDFSEGWNFGPEDSDCRTVMELVMLIQSEIGKNSQSLRFPGYSVKSSSLHEAGLLKLDISKSRSFLNFSPVMNIQETVRKTVEWYDVYHSGKNLINATEKQISEYYSRDSEK